LCLAKNSASEKQPPQATSDAVTIQADAVFVRPTSRSHTSRLLWQTPPHIATGLVEWLIITAFVAAGGITAMVDSAQEEHVTRFDEALVIVRHLRGHDDPLQAIGKSDNYRGLRARNE